MLALFKLLTLPSSSLSPPFLSVPLSLPFSLSLILSVFATISVCMCVCIICMHECRFVCVPLNPPPSLPPSLALSILFCFKPLSLQLSTVHIQTRDYHPLGPKRRSPPSNLIYCNHLIITSS